MGSSIPIASNEMKLGSLKRVLLQPDTLALLLSGLDCMLKPAPLGTPMFLHHASSPKHRLIKLQAKASFVFFGDLIHRFIPMTISIRVPPAFEFLCH
jgi:hypothetical protein